MKTVPSNKQLVRLANKIEINSFPEFILHLGLKTKEYENITYTYMQQDLQSIKFMILNKWMKDTEAEWKRPTWEHIQDSLLKADLNRHFLCQVLYSIQKSSPRDYL